MSTDLWTDYWGRDRAPASTDALPPAVRDAIAERWEAVFDALPSNSRILDIGTGTGALVELAGRSARPERPLSALGIDLATRVPEPKTSPPAHWRASFRGGIDARTLPFEDRSWTLVVSQFALEYGDFFPALAQAGRVCDRRLTLLVHAAEGAVVRQNAAVAEQIRWLLDELGLAQRLAEHVRQGDQASARGLAEVGGAMTQRIRETENPSFLQGLAKQIGTFLSGARPPVDAGLSQVAELESALRRHGNRMSALAAAAVTPTDLDFACDALKAQGFASARWAPQVTDDDRHLVGYWLTAVRPA